MHVKEGVALTGRNRTGPPCSVGRRAAHEPGRRPADRSRTRRPASPHIGSYRRQTTTTDADRRQRAKQ